MEDSFTSEALDHDINAFQYIFTFMLLFGFASYSRHSMVTMGLQLHEEKKFEFVVCGSFT